MKRTAFTLKDRATRSAVSGIVGNLPLGTRVEIGEETRTQRQNRAIHGLIGQIMKKRPEHRGIVMSMEAYKAVFMHGLGQEVTMIPSLDGRGMVPLGLSTSALTVTQFNDLVTFVLAWCANEGIEVRHFDSAEGGVSASVAPRRERAA